MVIIVGDPCPWTFLRNFKKNPYNEFEIFFSAEIFVKCENKWFFQFSIAKF